MSDRAQKSYCFLGDNKQGTDNRQKFQKFNLLFDLSQPMRGLLYSQRNNCKIQKCHSNI
jgi:hypothetical protein